MPSTLQLETQSLVFQLLSEGHLLRGKLRARTRECTNELSLGPQLRGEKRRRYSKLVVLSCTTMAGEDPNLSHNPWVEAIHRRARDPWATALRVRQGLHQE